MESEIEIVEGRGHRKYGIPTDSPFAPSSFKNGVDFARHLAENEGKEDYYHQYDGGNEVGVKIWARMTLGRNGQIYWSDAIRHVEKPVFPSKEEIIQAYHADPTVTSITSWIAACDFIKAKLDL